MRSRCTMSPHEFTIVFRAATLTDADLDRLFDAGCDDGTFGEVDGVQYAEFTRTALSLEDAVSSARCQIESAVPGTCFVRVEPDDFVTAADIASRMGRSRESVRLLIAGERGPGGFPQPISHFRTRSPRWSWADVTDWLVHELGWPPQTATDARYIARLNVELEAERLATKA